MALDTSNMLTCLLPNSARNLSSALIMRRLALSCSLFLLMYCQILLVTSVRGMGAEPTIVANGPVGLIGFMNAALGLRVLALFAVFFKAIFFGAAFLPTFFGDIFLTGFLAAIFLLVVLFTRVFAVRFVTAFRVKFLVAIGRCLRRTAKWKSRCTTPHAYQYG